MERKFFKIIKVYSQDILLSTKNEKILILLLTIPFFNSCGSENNFTAQTEADMIKYLEDNNLNAEKNNSGLYYIINSKGSGSRPTSSSNVTVAYKGYFLDGNTFDQSNADGISFGLNQVIAGWTEGLQLFKEGGEGVLLIPYNLGYGENGRGPIPGGAVLIFDIKLISVN